MRILISGNYNAFEDGFNGAGVYLISGLLPSNAFNLPVYYGSTADLRKRLIHGHFSDLTCNIHCNKPLQNYYNKNGGRSNLVVFLVESCSKEDNLKREQYYLDKERPFCDELRGFNIAKNTANPTKGRNLSIEHRRKLSYSHLGQVPWNRGIPATKEQKERLSNLQKGKKASNETRQKQSLARKGRSLSEAHKASFKLAWKEGRRNREQVKTLGASHSLPFKLLNPHGVMIEGTNLTAFCRDNGLSQGNLINVIHGKRKSHKGYTAAGGSLI